MLLRRFVEINAFGTVAEKALKAAGGDLSRVDCDPQVDEPNDLFGDLPDF